MIKLDYTRLTLEKRVPLTINRGTETHNHVLWVRLSAKGHEGWGEAVPFSLGPVGQSLEVIEAGLGSAQALLREWSDPVDRDAILAGLSAAGIPSAVRAGIDQALWDWLGRKTGLPVLKLWGGDRENTPLTSVTVGISSPEAAQARVGQWLAVGDVRAFKIKLGAPAGIAADQSMFAAVAEVVPAGMRMSVDANGGWSADDAITMSGWLAARGVDHIEQPLPRGSEAELPRVRKHSPLPIILDESVCTGADLPALKAQQGFDGINIKLMKCGGPSEALGLIRVARMHDLRILIGCYGSSALGNTAAACLGTMADYLDLDSHLNLRGDPFRGAGLREGRLLPSTQPGFGVTYDQPSSS